MCFAVYFQVDKQVAQNAQTVMMYVIELLRVSISWADHPLSRCPGGSGVGAGWCRSHPSRAHWGSSPASRWPWRSSRGWSPPPRSRSTPLLGRACSRWSRLLPAFQRKKTSQFDPGREFNIIIWPWEKYISHNMTPRSIFCELIVWPACSWWQLCWSCCKQPSGPCSWKLACEQAAAGIDLGDGQFSERCDVDGSFFNSDAIPIIFWEA